jgi:hypothetical protein
MPKCLAPVNYSNGAPGDAVASGSSLVLPRATAGSTAHHYTGASIPDIGSALCHARAAEGGAEEEEGRGNGGKGKRGRPGCWWEGNRSLGDRRAVWKEACYMLRRADVISI